MKKWVVAFGLWSFLNSSSGYATALDRPIGFLADKDFSPETGSVLMTSALSLYQEIDDKYIPTSKHENGFGIKLGRLAKYFIFEGTLASWAKVVQHEMFGHGYRAREFNLPVSRYAVNFYSGEIRFLMANYNRLNQQQKIAVATGGVEATTVLASNIRRHWLKEGRLDSRAGLLYLHSVLDQTQYVIDAERDPDFIQGHDIKTYIDLVNQWHNQANVLTKKKLKNKILIDFADPFLFYALFGMRAYILTGEQETYYPTLCIKDHRYLPALRARLAPWGPEYQWINFLQTPNGQLFEFIARYGRTGDVKSYGGTLTAYQLFDFYPIILDGQIDIWRQPKLTTESIATSKNKLGGAGMITMHYFLTNKSEAFVGTGYKTNGYMSATPLKSSILFKIGFRLDLV